MSFYVKRDFRLHLWCQKRLLWRHLYYRVVSFQRKCCHFLYMGIKKRSSKGCNCLQSFVFCGYSVVRMYLRGFQLGRIFFQPERIASVFNSGEMGLILASIDFVGTKSKINICRSEHNYVTYFGSLLRVGIVYTLYIYSKLIFWNDMDTISLNLS